MEQGTSNGLYIIIAIVIMSMFLMITTGLGSDIGEMLTSITGTVDGQNEDVMGGLTREELEEAILAENGTEDVQDFMRNERINSNFSKMVAIQEFFANSMGSQRNVQAEFVVYDENGKAQSVEKFKGVGDPTSAGRLLYTNDLTRIPTGEGYEVVAEDRGPDGAIRSIRVQSTEMLREQTGPDTWETWPREQYTYASQASIDSTVQLYMDSGSDELKAYLGA